MAETFLVRHCSTSGQEPEAELIKEGLAQANELAELLLPQNPRRLISSDFNRALQSAKPLALRSNVKVEAEPRLREVTLGEVKDGDWRNAIRAFLEDPELRLHSGESLRDAYARALPVLEEALKTEEGSIVLITHGLLITVLMKAIQPETSFDFWAELKNPDVFKISGNINSPSVQRLNL